MVIALVALVASVTRIAAAAPGPGGKTKAKTAASHRRARGSRGPRGYRGYQGPKGNQGTLSGVVSVKSPSLGLQPGQTTYDVDPNGFQANCPAGQVVIGTGFDAQGVGQVGFVESFGNFVGGFISNESSVAITVELQGLCAPAGADYANSRHASSDRSGSTYATALKQASAAYAAAH
jgi:hypothetical protein